MVKVSHEDYDAALADVSQLPAVVIYWTHSKRRHKHRASV